MLSLQRALCRAPVRLSTPWMAAALKRYSTQPDVTTLDKKSLYEVMGKESVTLQEFESSPVFNSGLQKAVKSLNFSEFTPVQQSTILPFLEEEGLVCRAKTGTGKTLSFVIPLLQHCMTTLGKANSRRRNVACLVIAPTRDLALQIHQDFRKLITNNQQLKLKLEARLWCGGMSSGGRGSYDVPQIIVGTPGRILANLNDRRYSLHFTQLQYRVYDEADRLLDQGFEEELNAIDERLQELRLGSNAAPLRNFLFSATIDQRVKDFARVHIGDEYKYIDCVDDSVADSHAHIEQRLVKTRSLQESHVAAVSDILEKIEEPNYKAIFFLPTVTGVNFMYNCIRKLLPRNFPHAWQLTGKMTQNARDRTTRAFKSTNRGILVCTDVAARGLDFKGVSDVIQISPAQQINDYIHKIGRTGRAGASGKATTYLSEAEMPFKKALYAQKNIEFSSETTYTPKEEDMTLFERAAPYPEDIEEYMRSLLGFLGLVCDPYKIDKYVLFRDMVDLQRHLIKDEEFKPFLSTRLFNQLGLPAALVPDYFTVDKPDLLKRRKPSSLYSRDRQLKYNRFANNLRGNDRYGDRSNNRYGSRNNNRDYDNNSRGYDNNSRGYDNYSRNDRLSRNGGNNYSNSSDRFSNDRRDRKSNYSRSNRDDNKSWNRQKYDDY